MLWGTSRKCKGGENPGYVKAGEIRGICGGGSPGYVKVGEVQDM